MNSLSKLRFAPIWTIMIGSLLAAAPASSQGTPASPSQTQLSTITGEVVSFNRSTLVIKDESGQFHLFVFGRDTVKPPLLASGSMVRVVSSPADEPGFRLANEITTLPVAPAAPPRPDSEPAPSVPAEMRRIERDIERQVRRFQVGVRTGVALDPELILLGVHAQLGPFFNSDVFVRPNVEFAFGEVTALFALNLEGIYRLPVSSRQGRWTTYVGVGPAFSFIHQNFERTNGDGRDIDFGDFSSDIGLNILGGLRFRSGLFMELKTSVYSEPAPSMRLIVGYNF